MTSEIRFPKINSDLVRTLTKTSEDYIRLARCYNSFKDSDSWPDGFGGSFTFTEDFIAKQMKNVDTENYFVITDPEDDNKIVGVSFVGGAHIKGCYYVQLLGVDPSYQKRGFGKALLLRCTRYATQHNSQFISLYTWPGNLKAMPLYKRQGYKWRPGTSVYMENYIPQILNFPVFRDFFSSLPAPTTWYDCFRPKIDQEPNAEFDGEMQIYEYYFQEGDRSLKVWIDRTIGLISGFHLENGNDDFFVKASIFNSRVFIGVEVFDIFLTIKNNSSNTKRFTFDFDSTSQIHVLNADDFKNSVSIRPMDEVRLVFKASLLGKTEELEQKKYTENFSDHKVTFHLRLNGLDFPLSAGILPRYAIKASFRPANFSVPSGRTFSLPIDLFNNLAHEEDVRVRISDGECVKFDDSETRLNLSLYDSSVIFNAMSDSVSTCIDWIQLTVSSLEGKTFFNKRLPVFVYKENKTISYEYNEQLFIENKYLRISLYKKPTQGLNEIIIDDKIRGLRLMGFAPILGRPFDDEGSEFYSLRLNHVIETRDDGVLLLSSSKSEKKPDIVITRRIFLGNDSSYVRVSWDIANTSDTTIEDLGLMDISYWWPGDQPCRLKILPLKDRGICHFNNILVELHLGKDPNDFSECWRASVFGSGVMGLIFDRKSVSEINIGATYPSVTHTIPDLPAAESFTTKPVIYAFTDSWQQVRYLWKNMTHYDSENMLEYWLRPRSIRRIGITTQDDDSVYSALLLDRSSPNTVNLIVDTYKETVLTGNSKINFTSIDTRPSIISLPDIKTSRWKQKLQLKVDTSNRVVTGGLVFDSLTRVYEFPLSLVFYDSSKTVVVNSHDNFTSIDNGFFQFKGSQNYRGQIFSLSIQGSDNILHTGKVDFPDIQPYLWYNKFYGGIGPILRPALETDQTEYNKLAFTSNMVSEGHWRGIEFISDVMTKPEKIRGVQLRTSYLTLPDSPVLLVRSIVENHSGIPRRVYLRHQYPFKTSKSINDYYFLRTRANEIAKYHLNEFEGHAGLDRADFSSWAAFRKDKSDFYFGVVLLNSTLRNEYVSFYAPNLDFAMIFVDSPDILVKAGGSITFSTLFLISDSLSSIEPFSLSNV
ncbi:MAG: GNAT family N-acetyltransferase [Candidatus Hodarchaeales archaeon]